ncbi:MAG: hypothetical protein ACOY0S_04340 [Patescibacteria group bacterium]
MAKKAEEPVAEKKAATEGETLTPEPKEPEVEKAPEVSEAPVTEPKEEEAPEGMGEEQARAFQEMRQEIKRLKEERAERAKNEDYLREAMPPSAPAAPPAVDINRFINPDTGEFDADGFNRAHEARYQALRAEMLSLKQDLDEREARLKHPELDKDKQFEEEVAKTWLWENYRGNPVSFSQVAAKIKETRAKTVVASEEEGAKKAMEALSAKEQASLEVSPQTSAAARKEQSEAEDQALRGRTRGGDDQALAQRMAKIPWVKRPEES